jgi:hypothetical protein
MLILLKIVIDGIKSSQFFRLQDLFPAVKSAFHAYVVHQDAVPAVRALDERGHFHFHVGRPASAGSRF